MNDSSKKPFNFMEEFWPMFNRKYAHKKEGEIIGYDVKPHGIRPPFDENGNFIEPEKTPIYCKKEWE